MGVGGPFYREWHGLYQRSTYDCHAGHPHLRPERLHFLCIEHATVFHLDRLHRDQAHIRRRPSIVRVQSSTSDVITQCFNLLFGQFTKVYRQHGLWALETPSAFTSHSIDGSVASSNLISLISNRSRINGDKNRISLEGAPILVS